MLMLNLTEGHGPCTAMFSEQNSRTLTAAAEPQVTHEYNNK